MSYARMCAFCHGSGAVSSGYAPDLRAPAAVPSSISFTEVVRDGTRLPTYSELTDEELRALQHYLRSQAKGEPLP